MAFNGTGTFVRLYNWINDRNNAIPIRADRMDAEMDGFATGLTNCITRDGQSTPTANLPMGNFRHTGAQNAAARSDYAAYGQIQDATVNWIAAAGTADAITASYNPAITTLVDGQLCYFRASAANATTTPTFAPNGLTARTITKAGGGALVVSDIPAALSEVILRYNLANTRWELLNAGRIPAVATQTNQESASSTAVYTSPGRQQYHPSAAKVWVFADTAGSSIAAYNVSSVSDLGTGYLRINFSIGFSSANYSAIPSARSTVSVFANIFDSGVSANSCDIEIFLSTTGVLTDPNYTYCAFFGDQA